MSIPIGKPTDLRTLSVKYAGRCHVCSTPISIGESCFYSPSLKKRGCRECWGSTTQAGDDIQGENSAENELQSEWRKFCTYLRTCLLAEAGESVFDFSPKNFPTLAGTELLFSSNADSIVLAGAAMEGMLGRDRGGDPRDFLYGWPTVVVDDSNGRTKVAPLFVVLAQAEKDPTSGVWTLTPKTDPDINIALLSGRIFDPSTAAEVDAAIDGDIDFGNRQNLAKQIQTIAQMLGLECYGMDNSALHPSYSNEPGVYNCALLLDANDNGASRDLLRELEYLAKREDWRDTAAAALLPSARNLESTDAKNKTGPVCGPLVLNKSLEEATAASRRDRITVVTGPPGTGKSQLVVSAVVNAWVDQESVLVTSTNNGAVDVAVTRAKDIAIGMLLRTGNRASRESLPSIVSEVAHQYRNGPQATDDDEGAIRARLALSQLHRHSFHDKLSEIEKLNNEMLADVLRCDELSFQLWGESIPINILVSQVNASKIKRLSRTLFFRRFRMRRLYIELKISFSDENVIRGKEWANLVLTYQGKRLHVESLEPQQPSKQDAILFDTDDEWIAASQSSIHFSIRSSIQNHPAVFAAIGNTGGGGAKLATALGLARRALRGWACTALSMNKNFALEAAYFDLAIIDEASQCNIAYILPIAYRAKRLLVVGDPNQLSPIVKVGRRTVDSITELCEMRQVILNNPGLDFRDGSAYLGFENSVGIDNVIILNEHYRCHPKIARWFNCQFYGGRLAVMTDISDMRDGHCGISWIDIPGQCGRPLNQRSWINAAEVREATEIVRSALFQGMTIGVVSPFSAQASAISYAIESEFGAEQLAEVRFITGTAHRLQGDERDIIIFSSCVAPGILDASAQWVEKERNLINVAVSRARKRLIILGHPNIGALKCPTLNHLRSFTLDAMTDNVKVAHRVDSESESRLLDSMTLKGLAPLAKVDVEGFELDFAIKYKGRKIDVEVDGSQHFDINLQRCRLDILRDRVLKRADWEVLRFPAWRCFVESEIVAEEISTHLESLD